MPLSAQNSEPVAPQGANLHAADDARLQSAITAGLASMNAGDHAGALAHLSPVADLAATRDMASYVFGLFYVNIGETERALEWLDRALSLRPAFPEALSARAVILHRQGRATDALASLDKVLALNPDDAEAFFMKGAIHQSLGNLASALEDFDRALRSKAALQRGAAQSRRRFGTARAASKRP